MCTPERIKITIRIRSCVPFLLVALLAAANDAKAARVLYVATNGNDSNNGLSTSAPLATMQKAHSKIDLDTYGDHVVKIRGGTYYGQSAYWTKHSNAHQVTIEAYKNELPTFDGIKNGAMQTYFLALDGGQNSPSNVTIRGLRIRNYRRFGIAIGFGGQWLGSNTIENNVFEKIGDRFLPSSQPCTPGDSGTRGYAAILIDNSGSNIVRDNVMVNIENCSINAKYIHGLYIQDSSSNNQIYDNYISLSSGDPFKVRDGSNNNVFHDNYVTRAGDTGFLLLCGEPGEAPSTGNAIDQNVVTFPYPPRSSIALIYKCNNVNDQAIDLGQRFFHGLSSDESFGAMATGDFRGNGQNELVVALNYSSFSIVLRTDNGAKPRTNRHLSKVVHVGGFNGPITAMTAGDYDGDGTHELLTATLRIPLGSTFVTRSNPMDGEIGQTIFQGNGTILAMTSGDFGGIGHDVVISSFLQGNQNYLYRGDGKNSLTNLGTIFASTSWRVTSMTSGDFDGDGRDELVNAQQYQPSTYTRLSRGNGTTSAINFGDLYQSSTYAVRAVAGGYFESTAYPTLITALWRHSDGFNNVYHHGYSSSPISGTNVFASLWDVADLHSGQYHTSAVEEVVAAFQNTVNPTGSEVHPGDGTTSLYNYGTFHKWDWP